MRRLINYDPATHLKFQSTHSLRSATSLLLLQRYAKPGFNPRTPCGVRHTLPDGRPRPSKFQSTHSLRSATSSGGNGQESTKFQSTHSLRSATPYSFVPSPDPRFQSTHSLRSATTRQREHTRSGCVSIHALLAECDLEISGFKLFHVVSIHALLAECDEYGAVFTL